MSVIVGWRRAFAVLSSVAAVFAAAPGAQAIVHGKAVSQARFVRDYPWAVALENPVSGSVCSGVLVSPTHVLTAAHCTAANKRVLYGNASRRRARRIGVVKAIPHPGYDRHTGQFDVGLLRLSEALPIRPISLISEAGYLLLVNPDALARVMGWGKRPGTGYSDKLVVADIRLHWLTRRGTYLYYDDQGGPCGGDSGGPMVVRGLGRKPVLVGVASTTNGNLCAKGGGIAAYTNIVAVRRFIEDNVKDLPD